VKLPLDILSIGLNVSLIEQGAYRMHVELSLGNYQTGESYGWNVTYTYPR
jgi:hypothetical protein